MSDKKTNKEVQLMLLENMQKLIPLLEEVNEKIIDINLNRISIDGEKWLTSDQVCKLLDISPRTLMKYRNNHTIPFTFIQGKMLYKETDLRDLLHKNYHK